MHKKILIICLVLLSAGCVLLPLERNFLVNIKTKHPTFDLQNAAGIKMAILPVRDFSEHYGIDYATTVMNTFIKEIKQKSPQVELDRPESTVKLLESVGKDKDYLLFLNRCDADRRYCLERNEMLGLFKNSGINYVVNLVVGSIDIPIPGSALSYSFLVIVYDIGQDGQVVYQAVCEGSVYPELLDEGPGVYLDSVMQDITRAVVAKMYPEPESQLKKKLGGWLKTE